MNQRSQFLGYALAALVVLSTDPLTGVGHGQFDLGSSATVTNHSVSVGRLIRSGRSRNGTPRFALLGDEGSVTAYVVPTAGMSLGSYLNKQVGITARSMRRGPNRIPYILAQKVSNLEPIVSESRDYDEPRIISADGLDELTEVMQDFQEEDEDSSLADLLWRDLDDEVVLAQAQETVTTPMPMTMTPTPGYTGDFAIEDGTYYPGVSDYPSMSAQGGIGMPMGAGCGDPTCTTCGPPRPARWWFRAEYLAWWTKGMRIPPLITTSPEGTPVEDAGVLGLPTTGILVGNQDVLKSTRGGGRLTAGYWFNDCRKRGIEVEYFALAEDSQAFAVSSGGDPIVARPFFNALLVSQDSELVAYPGIVAGTVTAAVTTELQSFAPRYRMNLRCRNGLPFGAFSKSNCLGGCECVPSGRRLDATLGFRYMRLNESLWVNERLTTLNTNTPSTFDLTDAFSTKNEFAGAELGLVWEAYRGRWTVELLSRLSLGNNRRSVAINGRTISAAQGVTFSDPGGLLALPTNMGSYRNDQFVAIPEIGANFGFHLSPKCRVILGYSALYWDKVVRPGDQIDLRVNTDFLPLAMESDGPNVPRFVFNDTSYWAQGFNLGLDVQW